MAYPEAVLDAKVPRLRRSRPARFAPDVAWTEGAWLAAGAAVTDLTPEREGTLRAWLDDNDERMFDLGGVEASSLAEACKLLLAALDAERARADKAERELEISQKVANDLFDLERAAEARNERLEAVAEAARRFDEAFQRSLGSASAGDILLRDQAQENLRAALAVLEEGEDTPELLYCEVCDSWHPAQAKGAT